VEKFKFVGEDPRDVPALGLADVQPGDVVEVADKALAAGLKGQPAWEPVTGKSTKTSQEG
jgi:hypothetical protein